MGMITKEELAQMNRPYFEELSLESLIEAAYNLRNLAVTLSERLEQNSENSTKPPSSDNPYKKWHKKKKTSAKEDKDIFPESPEVPEDSSADDHSEASESASP